MSFKFEIFLSNKSKKFYESLSQSDKSRIKEKLLLLAQDPFPFGYKKLKGRENLFRIRVGGYRILYTVDIQKKTILIFRIGRRESVYQAL